MYTLYYHTLHQRLEARGDVRQATDATPPKTQNQHKARSQGAGWTLKG